MRVGSVKFVLLIVLVLFASVALFAQSGALLEGTALDEQGGALPGVTVTATNNATGLNRVAVSGADGVYRMGPLPVGTYTILAELSGFASVTVNNAVLNVATTRTIDVTLKAASVSEMITVTAEAPLIASTPSIGAIISQKELEGLPLNGRQFANLASLAPGTSLSVNSDPTKPGQLTVALNGGSGRNVNFMVDGGDNTDDTIGGALQNFNLEAVQEFNIQTQQYKAEYGRTTGGVLTVVTKTGTNAFGGSAYGFFRDDSLNTKTTTEKNAGADKGPYERQQYGASFGGPIIKDRAHFFATYEKTDLPRTYTLATGGIYPDLDGDAVAIDFSDELITAKATWDISAKQYLQVRYGSQENSDKYGASPIILPSALGTLANDYSSLLLGHTAQLGSGKVNEFVYQFTKFNNLISADSNDPLLIYPSGVQVGQSVNTPQSTNQEKTQLKDDFGWSTSLGGRRHDFKTGFNYIDEPVLGGDFSVGTTGQYELLRDVQGSPVTRIAINGGEALVDTPTTQYSVYFQDDWSVNNQLTVNAGLRYDYFDGFDLDQRTNPIWQYLATQTTYNEYYLQDFQGGKGGKLSNDSNNYGPRVGFTYDLKGDGRQIVRGGWGIYYDFPYTNATILFPNTAVISNYGQVYEHANPTGILNANGSFYQPGQPLPPNQLPGADIPPPNEVASPTLATPKSTQASLGYSMEVNEWLGLNFEAVSIQYRDLPYRFRFNTRLDAQGRPQAARRHAAFGNVRMWMGDGEADYDGANIGFKARSGSKFQFQGFYTYSKTKGMLLAGADEFRLTAADAQPDVHVNGRDASQDSLNPHCDACYGPLYTDARHRFTISAVYSAPFGINVSGIARYRSALPYTKVNLAGADLNGDGFTLDLDPSVDHVNSERGDSFSQVDVRLSKELTFGPVGLELIGEVFNLFNSENGAKPNRLGVPTAYAGDPGLGEQLLGQLGVRVRF